MTVFSHSLAPEPTAVGAGRSAVAVRVASRRWLSFLRSATHTRMADSTSSFRDKVEAFLPARERVGRQAVGAAQFGHGRAGLPLDRKSTRLTSSHANISYAVFCLKKKKDT